MTGNDRLIRPVRAKSARTRDLPRELLGIPDVRQCELGDYEPGIYFLVNNRKVVYVAQSKIPRAQILAHRVDGAMEFDDAFIRHYPPEELDALERSFVDAMQPHYNCTTEDGEKPPPKTKPERTQIICDSQAVRRIEPPGTRPGSTVVNTPFPDTMARAAVGPLPGSAPMGLNRSGFVRVRDLGALGVPYCRSSIWRMVKTGEFPKPIKLGLHTTVWRIGDVLDWLEIRANQPYAPKLRRG